MTRPYLQWIENESDAFAATITTPNLQRPIADCPGWQLLDLVRHLGRVQSFWAAAVRGGGDRPGEQSSPNEREAHALREWFVTCSESLRVAVRDIPWDAPAWTWWGGPRTVAAVARHQVQEATVHRWDAEAAIGEPAVIDAAVADDAVAEFVEICAQAARAASGDAARDRHGSRVRWRAPTDA